MQIQRDVIRFGSGGETSFHPAVLAIVVLVIIVMFVLPRKYAIYLVILTSLLVPLSERIVFLGLHFMMLRVMLISGWIRMAPEFFERHEGTSPATAMDRAMFLWGLFGTVTFTLLWMDTDAFINRIGFYFFTIVGYYVLLRVMLRDRVDVQRAARALMIVAAATAVMMVFERVTGTGVWGPLIDRDGQARAQGPFVHSILAGTFGGTLLPICLMLWSKGGRTKFLALIGILSCSAIVLTTSSSTALVAYMAGIFALLAWPLRKHMRLLRWSTVVFLLCLQLVMKAPVWALIGRIDLAGGSSSYHRYMLVDQFIRRFPDWWLLGVKTTTTWGWDLWDTSNQYVEAGTTGGLVTFIAFVAIVVTSFRAVGLCRRAAEEQGKDQWETWCVGSALFAHAVGFFGISYFDQTIVSWLIVLAMIAALSNELVGVHSPVKIASSKQHGFVRRPVPGFALGHNFSRKSKI